MNPPGAVSFPLTTPDGVVLHVDEYRVDPARPVIVIGHGFFQHRGTPRFARIAHAFVSAGYNVLVFDFRGHGQSRGWYTFGRREPADLRAVLEYTRPRYRRVGLVTFSMGASIAIRLLGSRGGRDRQWADALIAVSAVADLNRVTPFRVWWPGAVRSWWRQLGTPRRFRGLTLHYGKPRALDHVDAISPVPVLFLHAEGDWLIMADHSRMLYERAGEPKQLLILPGRLHAEEFADYDMAAFIAVCRGWFDRWLATADVPGKTVRSGA